MLALALNFYQDVEGWDRGQEEVLASKSCPSPSALFYPGTEPVPVCLRSCCGYRQRHTHTRMQALHLHITQKRSCTNTLKSNKATKCKKYSTIIWLQDIKNIRSYCLPTRYICGHSQPNSALQVSKTLFCIDFNGGWTHLLWLVKGHKKAGSCRGRVAGSRGASWSHLALHSAGRSDTHDSTTVQERGCAWDPRLLATIIVMLACHNGKGM